MNTGLDRSLEQALMLTRDLPATPKAILRVAKEVGEDAARWAFEQWTLRARASSKFDHAEEMLFTREALEQATHPEVALYRASCFPSGEPVVDMTCGIGADLIALASRGPSTGFDLDPERVLYSRHNLRVHGLTAEVIEGDSLELPWRAEFAFADPARRAGGVRTFDPSHFAPQPSFVASRMASVRSGAIKLSPLMFDETLDSIGPRVEFVQFGGECREALVWLGSEVSPGRFAVDVQRRERLSPLNLAFNVEIPGEVIFEPGPAVIRAHCLGQFGMPGLGDANGYLTGPANENPWLRAYPVLWHGRFDVSEVRKHLIRIGAKTPEIKQRGAKQDLAQLRKRWILDGKLPVAVILWPVDKSLRAAIVSLD